jgi:YbbR domain-containing protein
VNARRLAQRTVSLIVHNWPLKVAAIALATLLYAGLVASQDANVIQGPITIVPLNTPSGTVITNQPLHDVDQIRYLAPAGVPRQRADDFRATVDLTNVKPDGQPTLVRVMVTAIDPRVTIVEVQPAQIQVVLDDQVSKTVPVEVVRGPAPSGVEVGDQTVDPAEVAVTGPASLVSQVVKVVVNVNLDPSGLDVDSEFDAHAVDSSGEVVSGVELEPRTVHVTIPLFTNKQSRTVPVNPIVTGNPAPGFRIASVAVDPQIISVTGDGDQLSALTEADTAPVALFGATSDVTQTVTLALPAGVVPTGPATVRVTVRIEAVTETRTYSAGLRLDGQEPGVDYALSDDQVLMTLYGSVAELDRLSSVPIVVAVNVAGLAPGRHVLPVVPSLPSGVTVAALSPADVTVTITAPASPTPGTETPSPSATPTAPPTASPPEATASPTPATP